MDRITNEKMMAINEDSDTVMTEIHKNHEEAVFLYDTSLVRPVNFEENGLDAVLNHSEVTQNIVPCSFYGCKKHWLHRKASLFMR